MPTTLAILAERLGRPLSPWDFRVNGVTSISADLHKYGYAGKGASVLLWRSMDFMRHQFFVATDWPGGIYVSPSMPGTRPGGPIAMYGVVFRDLLSRESGAPKWYELLQVYRRLEAGGEIRGGRFITGVGGEQYALGETVRHLRALRETPAENEIVVLCGADPLNLAGIITPHPRLPATASNRIAYLNGQPAAYLQGGEIQWLASPTDDQRLRIQGLLEGWREVSLDTTTLPSDLS